DARFVANHFFSILKPVAREFDFQLRAALATGGKQRREVRRGSMGREQTPSCEKNSKSQNPNSKKPPSSKFQNQAPPVLVIVTWGLVGTWDLGFGGSVQ